WFVGGIELDDGVRDHVRGRQAAREPIAPRVTRVARADMALSVEDTAVSENVVRGHEVVDQPGMRHCQVALSARAGGSNARTRGAGSLWRTISTRTVAEVGPWPRRDVPRSRGSTLAIPCAPGSA